MNWNDTEIRAEATTAHKAGLAKAGRMLEAFAFTRKLEIQRAVNANRICVVCGKPLLHGEDYIGLPGDLMACMSGCELSSARQIAIQRVEAIAKAEGPQ